MMIVTAVNVTFNSRNKRVLERKNGTSDYVVEVAINHAPPIWVGNVRNHIRKEGAAQLLRLIADNMDIHCGRCGKCLDCIRYENNHESTRKEKHDS